MRRSLICLFVMLLAAGIAYFYELTASTPKPVSAQGDQTASAVATKDSFAVPQADEVSTLISFIKLLKDLRPEEAGPVQDEYDDKAPAAILQACARIEELDRDAVSASRKFAKRELIALRMQRLSKGLDADEAARKTLIEDAVRAIQSDERTLEVAKFAASLSASFEECAPVDEAEQFYRTLGEMFAAHSDPPIAYRGQCLLGAARRLAIQGQPFELNATTIEGQPFDVASMKGKIVLVEFWASWCGHCLTDLSSLKRDYLIYHNRGFEVVAVSLDDDRNELLACLKKQRFPWTIIHDEEAGSEHPAAAQYGISAYPTSFLLDRDGRVLATDLRGRKLSRKLNELCDPVATKATPSSYPTFNVREVLDEMTASGLKLKKAGKTKSDIELRKGLDRESTEIEFPESSTEEISDRDLYRSACESVFIVGSLYRIEDSDEWDTALATAFAVTADGVLTTSNHVFDNEEAADIVVVMDIHKNVYPVRELLATNRLADTCLFRIDAPKVRPLTLAEDAVPGTKVRVLGHPGDSFYFFSNGTVANYQRDNEGATWMNITADFGQGSSGGPVMDECGNVVGQVSRTFTLYAGGTTRRGPFRRTKAEKAAKPPIEVDKGSKPDVDVPDPQMVFKSCVPVKTLRLLAKPK